MAIDPSTIVPEDAVSWLENEGWTRISSADGPASLWKRGAFEILVPQTPSASDFPRRVRELLDAVAKAEHRAPEDVGEEIAREGVDVADWRASGDSYSDSIPLADGVELVRGARDALVAAASARIHRRGYFGHSVPQIARDQALQVRMGHTRRGSYVVPIISPHIPRPIDSVDEDLFDVRLAAEPFPRQALVTLATGLDALHRIVIQSERLPSAREVNESVGEGVSYELSNAVKKVLSGLSVESLDITFSWARRSQLPVAASHITFPREALNALNEVTNSLRGSGIVAEQSVVAFVRRMSREKGDPMGQVQLRSATGQGRLMNAELPPEYYERANEAHIADKAVVVRGRLHKEAGRTWRFDSVSDLSEAGNLTIDRYEDLLNDG